jgi:hypothetical protein
MRRALYPLLALILFGAGDRSVANIIVQPTFEEKMAQAELVVIGTVTARQREDLRGSVTIRVLRSLKGEAGETLTVATSHGVPEMDPPCCVVGATYLMFLARARNGGRLIAVGGPGGIVMVGGAPNQITVVPARQMQ